jgi:glycerol kinase
MSVLAIDAGTTGVTALVVGADGSVLGRGYAEFLQRFPRPGWVEHEPEDIWSATLTACRAAVSSSPQQPIAVGITNQRETAVLWDRRSLRGSAAGDRLAGPAYGGHLLTAARRRARGPGP